METNIMEHTTLSKDDLTKVEFDFFPNKEAFAARAAINLLDISNDLRKDFYLIKSKELTKKAYDLDYLINKLKVVRSKSKLVSADIEEINSLEGKINSISKTKLRLEKEVSLICKASMIANLKENDSKSASLPIGEESAKLQLQTIIENHMEVFESTMYEQLCCNSAEVVIPVLNKILEHHGYKVSKITKKKI